MTSSERLALQRVRTVYAPDERVTCLEIDVDTAVHEGVETAVLSGVVQTDRIRRSVVDAVDRASTCDVRAELSVLEEIGESRTTDRRVLPVRGAPSADAEQVTQVLYGAELTAYDDRDGWRRIRTPSGYLGWVDARSLSDSMGSEPTDWTADSAVVTTAIDPNGGTLGAGDTESVAAIESLPAGVDCRLESRGDVEAIVSFRTGVQTTLPASSIHETTPVGTGDDVVTVARQFLGTPYEWGGMTTDGIDCSGLVWVSYAAVGVSLPRDADQQETMGTAVDRDDLEPGDLLFFPGHVAISLGGTEYVHASGSAGEVTVNSLDGDDDRYVESLDESLTVTKRLLSEDGS